MSKSKFQKHQQPLTTLQSMINGVLIETGKALRAANQKGSKTIGHTHAGLQASIPATIESFHLALDELEIDILRAKAVLGRDLSALQARRNQLENPTTEGVETSNRDRDRDEQSDGFLRGAIGAVLPEADGVEVKFPAMENDNSATEDLNSLNMNSPKAELDAITGSPLFPSALARAETESQVSLPKPEETRSGDVQAGNDEAKNASSLIDPDANSRAIISDAAPSADSEAPVTSGFQDDTFDELFDGNNGESTLDFDDFNFTGGDSGNHNTEFSGNPHAGEFDLSSFGNSGINESGDPLSMVQGLETFEDGNGGEFNLPDMSNNATEHPGAVENAGNDFGISGEDLDMALGNSIFDDMLEGMDFGGGDDGTGGDTMEHGEFDEKYFGLNSDG